MEIINYQDKICPFCRSTSTKLRSDFEKIWVECTDCDSRGPAFYSEDYLLAGDMAQEYWHNRYRSD